MTPSNLDLASELWAMSQGSNPIDVATSAIAAQLDAFAERIRADERAALVSAPVQTAVTVEHDSTPLPEGIPEPAGFIIRSTKRSSERGMVINADEVGSYQRATLSREPLYTAAQVQAMLAKHVPVAAFDRLQSLADSQAAQLLAFDDAVERKPSGERATLIADLRILEGEQMHSTHAAWVCAAADMLAADTPVERKPLTDEQISDVFDAAKRDLCKLAEPGQYIAFRRTITRAIEAAHGIKAQQGSA